jgi:hypothetical protein
VAGLVACLPECGDMINVDAQSEHGGRLHRPPGKGKKIIRGAPCAAGRAALFSAA